MKSFKEFLENNQNAAQVYQNIINSFTKANADLKSLYQFLANLKQTFPQSNRVNKMLQTFGEFVQIHQDVHKAIANKATQAQQDQPQQDPQQWLRSLVGTKYVQANKIINNSRQGKAVNVPAGIFTPQEIQMIYKLIGLR